MSAARRGFGSGLRRLAGAGALGLLASAVVAPKDESAKGDAIAFVRVSGDLNVRFTSVYKPA